MWNLDDWLRWAQDNGPQLSATVAEAAFMADLKDYYLIRSSLLRLKEAYPIDG